MKHSYSISGMRFAGCVASVKEKLAGIDGVKNVTIDLGTGVAEITMSNPVPIQELTKVLSKKYTIDEKANHSQEPEIPKEKSKFHQLRPLFLVFGYLFVAVFLLNHKDYDTADAMLDFMGLFFIVFSFFKLLDLRGFPDSFKMYDPLAKAIPFYGWVYPFVELALGLMFLMRFEIKIAVLITLVILGITTFGVTKTLLNKKSIRCACLGTALNLPMTEATFIENTIMLVMAILMLANPKM